MRLAGLGHTDNTGDYGVELHQESFGGSRVGLVLYAKHNGVSVRVGAIMFLPNGDVRLLVRDRSQDRWVQAVTGVEP